jgi:enamine deaminase RidA (YjgF/YER057c/UK114 family)
MLKHITPTTIRKPFANYAHGVEVPAEARLVFCSGQLGISADDMVPSDTLAQASLCFGNIEKILKASDMGLGDIVRINAYVTGREHLAPYMAARDNWFGGGNPPASTLMIVSGFAREEFKVEIEVVAAKVDTGRNPKKTLSVAPTDAVHIANR